MDDTKNVGGRDRLVRLLLTIVLSIVAVRSLRRGKRLRGLLAGVGALGLGFNATTGYCGVNDALSVDTTSGGDVEIDFEGTDSEERETGPEQSRSSYLTCASCGDPIVPGQRRGPNGQDDIVHDDCL
ncbi:DUF2892 domain-containing protein [Haloarcula sp. S1CR25-12]|uniref:DUF2892 domain-containing protein n=1 Tax=Haloarcula saliterrae TaxID=2950534 RepID=A0ABU2FB27_9EURY|nr:DUF2892 domain-containing protein [Haloarcula sp. S1CR25-12]MDS0259478.1 DUF2892 domain-containing protein [Haloarcula sp. S1CR25-12]